MQPLAVTSLAPGTERRPRQLFEPVRRTPRGTMRYLEVTVRQAPTQRDPMHQFVVEHDAYDATRLLSRTVYDGSDHAALFHVDGPVEPYTSALGERETVHEFAVTQAADDTFYLYVYETVPDVDRAFADAFAQPGLLVQMPVEYRADGSVHVTAIGPAAAVQRAVETLPDAMRVDVEAVGTFVPGRIDARLELTSRQLEAVDVAVGTGYYDEPRDATLEEVAEGLDCSTGTAGELLRRAERTVMSNLVGRDG